MRHRLVTPGCERFVPFAESCITKLKKLNLPYADQSFEVEGCSIKVRIEPGHEYIRLSLTAKGDFWCLSKEYVGDVPSLCVYSLTIKAGVIKAKRLASFRVYPGEASSTVADVYGTTTAWVINGKVETFQSRSYGSPADVHPVSLDAFENYLTGDQYMTTTANVANDTSATISCSRFTGSSSSTSGVVARHLSSEPGLGGIPGAYADYYHIVRTHSGAAINPPSFSYYCAALSTLTYTYPPITYSLGEYFYGATKFMYVAEGAPEFIGGTVEAGALSVAHAHAAVAPAAILTETQPGTISARIWLGNGKAGLIDPEFTNGYYVADALSSVNPVTGKYVLRMFQHYYFGFETGGILARAYTYAGDLITSAPAVMVPDFQPWIDRLLATTPSQRKEWRRWINVGRDATIYEWTDNEDAPRFGVVAHGNDYMQDVKTQTQLFGVIDVTTRAGDPWFVPVRPYVVGPEFSKMTPFKDTP